MEKAAYESETWRKLECERVYHAVSEQPDRNIADSRERFLACVSLALGLC